ncbi:uncharacterized protein LOC111399490 isoform X2 [Olea europaea var. sylvestris]|uniref:uncharacterized protein LOC111399490 isoform X2 n=1 Tax=Olea europaea var. sylvestris TaxID=158386 RepID=UPI000C1CE03C|nr:uncharacterized protein LOC111399490 isoform X2 [Olea europaea var. sylvestris]
MEYINGQRSRRKITVLFKRKGQRKNRGDMGKKIRVFSYSVFLLLITLESSFASSLSQSNSNQGIEHSISRNLKEDQSQVPEVHCSRERSRAAWKVIEEYLMPFLEREKYQLSSKCRLHPSNDIFRDQEENKIHVDINEWRCGYCKKIFRAEKYLDQHFDNRHLNLLNISGSKCLADVCGALHCDLVMDTQSRKTKCNPAAAAKNHHLCEDLADSCFPVNQGPPATRLHEAYKHLLPGNFNTDFDVPPNILPDCLFVPKRNENGRATTQAHLKTWKKTKAFLMEKLLGITYWSRWGMNINSSSEVLTSVYPSIVLPVEVNFQHRLTIARRKISCIFWILLVLRFSSPNMNISL